MNRLEEGGIAPLLQVIQVSKRYGETDVLKDVDYSVSQGSIHGIIGQNGAGKSTLVGIISGVVLPDAGEIILSGEPLRFGSPREALQAGIATVYQELSLLSELTVFENMFLGDEILRGRHLDNSQMIDQTRTLLAELGGEGIDPLRKTWRLSLAQRQLVEIARCVRRNVKVLILDEPSAVLGASELSTLLELLEHLKSRGTGVIYISHRLAEVEQVSDRITVLRDGYVALRQDRSNFDRQQLVTAMVGEQVRLERHQQVQHVDSSMLSVNRMKLHGGDSEGISFVLGAGEILGIVGHTGSGRSRLLKTLVGIERPVSGVVEMEGAVFSGRALKKLRKRGVRYLPEDRKKLGLFLDRNISQNIVISDIVSLSRFGFLNTPKITRLAQDFYDVLRIRARGLGQRVGRLSGGNQQKVLLARTMLAGPRILLLDEPLRGVDVGAKAEILEAIKSHVSKGNAALVVSSELADIIALTNRVLIMRDGRLHGTLQKPNLDENELALAVANS